jgi:hypothetical protein
MIMRNTFVVAIVIVLFSISSASAQFLGQLSPAPTLNKGEALLGAYLGVYEDAFSIFGQFRYGIARYFDLGFKMGMIDLDPGSGESNTGLTVGGDMKYWFMEQHAGDPLDVSVGGGMEYLSISDYDLFSLGGNVIASYQIKYYEGRSVTPYGRLNIRWERQTYKGFWHPRRGWVDANESDSDMRVALALGAELKLSSGLFLVGELEIDDNVGFVGGINYNLF